MGILIKDANVVVPVYKDGVYEKSEVVNTSIGILGKNIYFILLPVSLYLFYNK